MDRGTSLKLICQNGSEYDFLGMIVKNKIITNNVELPFSVGDTITRYIDVNNITERYTIESPDFSTEILHDIRAGKYNRKGHFEIKVKRENQLPKGSYTNNSVSFLGNTTFGGDFNVGNTFNNQSLNIEEFNELPEKLKEELIAELENIRKTKDTSTFKEKILPKLFAFGSDILSNVFGGIMLYLLQIK